MKIKMDHLVLGVTNLAQGVDYLKEYLGVDIPYGGEHLKMGTHNHLVQLGNTIFLEVIAINPDAKPPEHPRWYGLDDPFVRRQIEKQPTLLTWVVNTENISQLMQQANVSFGKAELISRGDLSWHIGIPDDGRLLAAGMLPYIIEWHTDFHPAENMPDSGCQLQRLEICHPHPCWLESILESIGARDLVKVHALQKNKTPYLIATINTPRGTRELRSDVKNE